MTPADSRPSDPMTPAVSPATRPAPTASPAAGFCTMRSSATVRSRISIPLASSAASSARCTSAPDASSPECTIRWWLCPPSSRSSRVSSRAPSPASQSITPGAASASAATTSGSHSPAPAVSVSLTCDAALSPGPMAAARPPCASGVAPPIRSLVTISTRSPAAAAVSAAEIPAAPDPTTTTSASRRHRARTGGSARSARATGAASVPAAPARVAPRPVWADDGPWCTSGCTPRSIILAFAFPRPFIGRSRRAGPGRWRSWPRPRAGPGPRSPGRRPPRLSRRAGSAPAPRP